MYEKLFIESILCKAVFHKTCVIQNTTESQILLPEAVAQRC